jgi:hypothetical protein
MRKIEKLALTATVVLGTVIIGRAQDETSPESSWNPEKRQQWREVLADYDYIAIARAYADYMIEYGRDRYGKVHSPLFVSVMNRESATVPTRAAYPHPFMTRYLDKLASARFNTLFLWASHPFLYLLDLPEYPGATKLQPERLRQNQEQFRWLVSECGRRNISVLLHFYNIHLPDGLREQFGGHASWGASAVKNPSPEIANYYRYVLGRHFEEFDNVGLYICPGETLATSRQLEWFRDVIFKAAKESRKNPLLIMRDWTLNMNFREQIPALYENCYSELKHNDETFTASIPSANATPPPMPSC